jgi:hypothetical protein
MDGSAIEGAARLVAPEIPDLVRSGAGDDAIEVVGDPTTTVDVAAAGS